MLKINNIHIIDINVTVMTSSTYSFPQTFIASSYSIELVKPLINNAFVCLTIFHTSFSDSSKEFMSLPVSPRSQYVVTVPLPFSGTSPRSFKLKLLYLSNSCLVDSDT